MLLDQSAFPGADNFETLHSAPTVDFTGAPVGAQISPCCNLPSEPLQRGNDTE